MTHRYALLVGNSVFDDSGNFPELKTPSNDVKDLASTLITHGDFEVGVLENETSDAIGRKLEELYANAEFGDLTLFFYSGHGCKTKDGRLYLAGKNTKPDLMLSTGIGESFLRDAMRYSRSKHKIIILDSCFSGTFIKGMKSGNEPLSFTELMGEATAILTSSSSIQYSFEVEESNSLFTHYLLEGINSGLADEDRDGLISIDELFRYIDRNVRKSHPNQSPMLDVNTREVDKVIIAKSPTSTLELPHEIVMTIKCPYPPLRQGALEVLEELLISDPRFVTPALKALGELRYDGESAISSRAIRLFEQYSALATNPNLSTLIITKASSIDVQHEYDRAVSYMQNGNFYAALDALQDIILIKPNYKDVRVRIEKMKNIIGEFHVVSKINPVSEFLGLLCPVSRQIFKAGDTVVICQRTNNALSLGGWELLEHCPYCNDPTANPSISGSGIDFSQAQIHTKITLP